MSRFRPLARALAWLWPLAASACLHDAPVAPGAGGSALRIQAQLAASQVHQALRVRAFYTQGDVTVNLPVSPSEIRVPDGVATTQNVTARLDACLAAFAGAGGGCPLSVEITLVDDEGEMLSRAQQSVAVTNATEPVTVPPFVLTEPAVALSVGSLQFTADQGGGQPPAFTVTATSATGAALGTLSVAITSSAPDLLTATIDQSTGVITIRPTAPTLAPGTYTATVAVNSSRGGIRSAPIAVSYVVRSGGAIAGTVRNAVNNAAIGGATVNLYAGTSASGTPIATQTATATGTYRFEGVTAGTYTVAATATGFITSTAGPLTVATGAPTTADIAASPVLATGQTRIVLTWGTEPRDLDSHLYGPPSANNYHLFYGAMNQSPFAVLDLDDTSGEGPETVTITQQPAGRHVYAVHHFAGSGSIAASGARVRVFRGNELVAEFTPPSQPGRWWTVFELNGTQVVPVNRLSDEAPTQAAELSLRGTGAAAASASRTAPPIKKPRPAARP